MRQFKKAMVFTLLAVLTMGWAYANQGQRPPSPMLLVARCLASKTDGGNGDGGELSFIEVSVKPDKSQSASASIGFSGLNSQPSLDFSSAEFVGAVMIAGQMYRIGDIENMEFIDIEGASSGEPSQKPKSFSGTLFEASDTFTEEVSDNSVGTIQLSITERTPGQKPGGEKASPLDGKADEEQEETVPVISAHLEVNGENWVMLGVAKKPQKPQQRQQ